VEEIFSTSITLAIATLRNIYFVVRRFKFDLALLKEFHLEDVFVVGCRFETNEEHGKGEFDESMLDVEYVGYGVS
jgi:hypothetical protein